MCYEKYFNIISCNYARNDVYFSSLNFSARKDVNMARKKATTKKVNKSSRAEKVSSTQQKQTAFANFAEYLRLGESYTSLVLGIVFVIIAPVVLLSIVHVKQGDKNTPDATPTIAASNSLGISVTAAPTAKPTPVKPTPTAAVVAQSNQYKNAKTYVVVAGDNLWAISEKVYNSGYNWVDIAKANKLVDPGNIHVGDKLVLPKVAPKMIATVHTNDDNLSSTVAPSRKIVGNTYVVVHGDDLWDIAVRAYGDGYQWVKIARVNNLNNPNLIHVGNKLQIPRG